MAKDITNLLKSQAEKLTKFQQIVQQAIDEEKLIVENFLHQPDEVLSMGQRISDGVASFGGSWKFIISFRFSLQVGSCLTALLLTETILIRIHLF